MKAVYFFLLIFSVCFHLLYNGDLSFIVMAFVIVFPLFSLIILFLTSLGVKASISFEQPSAVRGNTSVLKLTVRNRSLFPVPQLRADVIYRPSMLNEAEHKERFYITAPLGSRTTESFLLNIKAGHCGTVEIISVKMRIRDILGLFRIPLKTNLTGKIISLPVIHPVQAAVESNLSVSSESGTFSQVKPGDDPSEIFALREYREGDSHNRIHWKLSSRSETFVVKELSQPVGCSVLIIPDMAGCRNPSEADAVLDAVFSISHFLTEYGAAHTIAHACSDYSIHTAEITDTDCFYNEMSRLCSEIKLINTEKSFAYTAGIAENPLFRKNGYSRIIAVTAKCSGVYADELETLVRDARTTIICVGNPDDTNDENERFCTAEIIYADAEKLSEREFLTI